MNIYIFIQYQQFCSLVLSYYQKKNKKEKKEIRKDQSEQKVI